MFGLDVKIGHGSVHPHPVQFKSFVVVYCCKYTQYFDELSHSFIELALVLVMSAGHYHH